MKHLLLLFFISSGWFVYCQSGTFIEGQLLDGQTKEEIRFAKIYNRTLKKGALTDDEGYFRIDIASDTDEIVISYIGYKKQNLLYDINQEQEIYYLTQKIQFIDQVMIYPKDLHYLYELISACKRKSSTLKSSGKAVYELKSFMDGDQIELVEGYYNFKSRGYDLDRMDMKTARLGVQMKNEKMFVSLESSRAVATQNLLIENDHFPHSPFEYSTRKMRKKFTLQLRKKYLNDDNDSIFVIDYYPRNDKAYFFEGTLWLNNTTKNILKVTTNSSDCKRHPFLPIFPSDTITKLDMYITRTFRSKNGRMGFNHVDFKYNVQYKSRTASSDVADYNVKTQAVLYGYEFENEFSLPHFKFEDNNIGDYRKVNAIPYDDFFWEYNDEDHLTDRKDQNKNFMDNPKTIESRTLFSPNAFFSKGLLEHPYKNWSPNRFVFRSATIPTSVNTRFRVTSGVGTAGPLYRLKVRVFADINTYGDSTNIITATVFDPYESFSRLLPSPNVNCAINMYFDIYEIARLKFLSEIKRQRIPNEQFDAFYKAFFAQIDLDAKLFLREVERGQNEEKMEKWNSFILQNLGIDNLNLFKPFEKEEEEKEQ